MAHKDGSGDFNPQGSREPRRVSTTALTDAMYFNPQGSREPRRRGHPLQGGYRDFNPQGSREPRPSTIIRYPRFTLFQSTRLSRASTLCGLPGHVRLGISIHKALASLDLFSHPEQTYPENFNPQGSREPRPAKVYLMGVKNNISIHKALASLDAKKSFWICR